MNIKIIFATIIALLSFPISADTFVNGYYRKDGTYVKPHYRSSPNSTRSDNYGGRSSDDSIYGSPYMRDLDGDGISNQFDVDDDNDGRTDDYGNN